MSPWCAVAVETVIGFTAAAPLASVSEPRCSQIATMTRIITTASAQIHQRLLCVGGFSGLFESSGRGELAGWVDVSGLVESANAGCADFWESLKFDCCSVTRAPQICEGTILLMEVEAAHPLSRTRDAH